ncbi:MAG: glycosyltransferase [Betaproteobacteria bacterium]|nr:glycosyltransferase [Betaproteobacteria bacterium]
MDRVLICNDRLRAAVVTETYPPEVNGVAMTVGRMVDGLRRRGQRVQLVRLRKANPPDIVHIVTEGPLGWSALKAAETLGLPVSTDFHTNFPAYSRHYGIGWLHKPIMGYLRKFHNRASCTLVPTRALKEQLEGHGYANLRVVARGVDTTLFSPSKRSADLRASWGADSEDLFVFLPLARLHVRYAKHFFRE